MILYRVCINHILLPKIKHTKKMNTLNKDITHYIHVLCYYEKMNESLNLTVEFFNEWQYYKKNVRKCYICLINCETNHPNTISYFHSVIFLFFNSPLPLVSTYPIKINSYQHGLTSLLHQHNDHASLASLTIPNMIQPSMINTCSQVQHMVLVC